MQVAIVTDIHANLQAWLAVMADCALRHVEQIISLGDIVGYGPNPAEVCMLARSRAQVHLLGNHEAAMCGRTTLDQWNSRARLSVEWSRKQLSQDTMDWFAELPYTLALDDCRFGHSEFSCPERFYYIREARHALLSWNATREPLLFVGHTHIPALYVLGASGTPHRLDPQPFIREPGKRYLVNVGSVGFPREQIDMASYCILNLEECSVRWQSVRYDVESYRLALHAQGFSDPRMRPTARDGALS